MIKEHMGKDTVHILDSACGEGTLGKLLKENYSASTVLTGCDISETALSLAAPFYDELHQINLEHDDLLEKMNNKRFDFAIALEVLEHLFEPEKALHQLRSLLEDNGILIASFPNIAWYQNRLDLLRGDFPKDYLIHNAEHIHHFTLNSFHDLLENAGFELTDVLPCYKFPRWIRPKRLFYPILKQFPSLFGYQIVTKARIKKN